MTLNYPLYLRYTLFSGLLSFTLALTALCLLPLIALANTITVNTTTDQFNTGGSCSLRDAIQSANTNTAVGGCTAGSVGVDTVEVPTGIYTLTLAGMNENFNATGDLDVLTDTGGIILRGLGTFSSNVVISANKLDRVLHGQVPMTVMNLTIRNDLLNSGSRGGGASFSQTTTVMDTTFFNNVILGSNNFGGGVYFNDTATIMRTTFFSNSILGSISSGGGAYFSKTVTMTGSSFISNTIPTGASSTRGAGAYFNDTATVEGTSFLNNKLYLYGGTTIFGGGAYFYGATMTISGSIFSGYHADSGGGAFIIATNNVMLSTSIFSNNTANLEGGGAYLGGNKVMVTGTTFISNSILHNSGQGGGLHIISNNGNVVKSTFSNNQGSAAGGGIYSQNKITVTESIISGNKADLGGGMYFAYNGNVIITNSIISYNSSTGGGGGGMAFVSDGLGPIKAKVVNTLFNGNSAGIGVIYTDDALLEIIHTTIATPTSSNGYAIIGGQVYITNTIISSHTAGIEPLIGMITEDYNLFFGFITPPSVPLVSGGHSFTNTPPLFVDPINHNYRLQSSSLAVGAGTPLGILTDFEGDPRSTTRPAMGYDEVAALIIKVKQAVGGVAMRLDSAPNSSSWGLMAISGLMLWVGIWAIRRRV